MTLRRTSDDGMGTVDVTDDELASMAALDVSEAVEVLRGHARVRVSMNGRHNALYAARDLLQLAPAMAAELRARSSRTERIEAAARALVEATRAPGPTYAWAAVWEEIAAARGALVAALCSCSAHGPDPACVDHGAAIRAWQKENGT